MRKQTNLVEVKLTALSMFSRVLENGNDKAAFADLVERARTLLQSKGVDLPDEE